MPAAARRTYGYVVGNWYGMDFSETGGSANYTGNFRWIDFDPSTTHPVARAAAPGAGLPARRLGSVQPAAADHRQLHVERQL